MSSQESNDLEISDEQIIMALNQGRMLMADCSPLQPESHKSDHACRTEWSHGSVAPTIYCDATSGTQAQRMLKLLQYFAK